MKLFNTKICLLTSIVFIHLNSFSYSNTKSLSQNGAIENGNFWMSDKSKVFIKNNKDLLDLQQGVMLVKSKKGLFKKPVNINTKVAKIKAKATMMISYQPRKYIKIVCIDGKVNIALKSLKKSKVKITTGQMLIINCLENHLSDVINIDMAQLMNTSNLISNVRNQDADIREIANGLTRNNNNNQNNNRRNNNGQRNNNRGNNGKGNNNNQPRQQQPRPRAPQPANNNQAQQKNKDAKPKK